MKDSIKTLLCATIIIAAAPWVMANDSLQRDASVIKFHNPKGTVTFDHDLHRSNSCKTCHNPTIGFDYNFDHSNGYSLRAHTNCISCHKKENVSVACSNCHEKPSRKDVPFDKANLKAELPENQKMLDFFAKRRSIRSWSDKPVSDALITDLLKIGMTAPSAGGWQPWEFIVVRDQAIKDELSKTSPFADYVNEAPVIIVIAGRTDNIWSTQDTTMASANILNAAANLGLGATYAGLDNERDPKARAVLGIPDGYKVYNFIPLGYPKHGKPAHTKYNLSKIHFESFEAGRPELAIGH